MLVGEDFALHMVPEFAAGLHRPQAGDVQGQPVHVQRAGPPCLRPCQRLNGTQHRPVITAGLAYTALLTAHTAQAAVFPSPLKGSAASTGSAARQGFTVDGQPARPFDDLTLIAPSGGSLAILRPAQVRCALSSRISEAAGLLPNR